MGFCKTAYFRCMESKLNSLSEEMDDGDVIRAVNEMNQNRKSKSDVSSPSPQSSFIFSLKNRVGGLARALRIFQENGINVVHIESRRCKRFNSEYEIFVNLECMSEEVPTLVKALKRQLSYVRIDDNLLDDLSSSKQQQPNGDEVKEATKENEAPAPGVESSESSMSRKSESLIDSKKPFQQKNFKYSTFS